MTRNDNANHVRAVRTANRAARIFIAESLRHPGIRTRFADSNLLQNFPGAQLKWRPDRRQRNVELQVLARKIISKLLAGCREVAMLARNDIRCQALAQNR